jgi:hypothetical protein
VLVALAIALLTRGAPAAAPCAVTLSGTNVAGGEFNGGKPAAVYAHDYIYPAATEITLLKRLGLKMMRVPVTTVTVLVIFASGCFRGARYIFAGCAFSWWKTTWSWRRSSRRVWRNTAFAASRRTPMMTGWRARRSDRMTSSFST